MGILLSSYDLMNVTFAHVLQAIALVIIVWEAWKKIKEIKKESDADHKRKESWDHAAKVIEEKEKVWDDAVSDIRGERKLIVERYDARLDDLEKQIKENHSELERRIDDNHSDTEAKIQEVRADVMILTEAIRAVLEGQIEQGCNGPVKEAKNRLDTYLVESLGR